MKRMLTIAVLASATLPAGTANGQRPQQPPPQQSSMTVQVGNITVLRPCLIGAGRIFLGRRDPNLPPTALDSAPPYPPPPPPTGSCKGYPALRLERARRMTITAQSTERITATWFASPRGAPTAIPVRSTAAWDTWLLTLPLASGRLVLSRRYWPTYIYGPLTQARSDYKLWIRRTMPPPGEGPVEAGLPASEPAVTFDGSG
jgi:hypothetical protein